MRFHDVDYANNNYPIVDVVYPGNDFTKAIVNKLLEFAKTGYPIVLAKDMVAHPEKVFNYEDIFKYDFEDVISPGIDSASYVYELFETLFNKKSPSLFFELQVSKKQNRLLAEALTIKKFTIDVIPPLEYVDRTIDKNKDLPDSKVYINGNGGGDKTITFNLKINSNNDNKYIVKAYVDINADGKFVAEEELDGLQVYDKTTGKYVRYNNLVKDHQYVIERSIEEYVGAIPWSLDVIDSTSYDEATKDYIVRCNEKGLCAIKATEKKDVNVLQITTDEFKNPKNGEKWNHTTICLPTDEEIAEAKKYNKEHDITEDITAATKDSFFTADNCKTITTTQGNIDNLRKNASRFYYYMKQLNEFNIHITRVDGTKYQEEAVKDNKYLMQFDMVIVGFSDVYSDITEELALKQLENFINEGRTVLFTHDTTSYLNMNLEDANVTNLWNGWKQKEDGAWWGYNINKYYRSIVGMDRYDVMDNHGKLGKVKDSADKVYIPGAKKPSDESTSTYDENLVYTNKYDNDAATPTRNSSIDITHGTSVDKTTRALNQGFTKYICFNDQKTSGWASCSSITQTNYGQIVGYPYTLGKNITVAKTHSQYYQLDLEDDDIVVWYTMSNEKDNNPNSGSKSLYKTKNDVRNNYYIYNKGNITYSGVGHDDGVTEDEAKLFVNTMVAAYNATIRASVPVLTNSDKSSDNSNGDYLYVDYDATANQDNAEPFGEGIIKKGNDYYKRAYFTVKNNSIVLNKTMLIQYYPVIETDEGEVVLDGHYYKDEDGETKSVPYKPLYLTVYEYEDKGDTGTQLSNSTQKVKIEDKYAEPLTGTLVNANGNYYVDIPIDDAYYQSEGISYTDDKGKTYDFKALGSNGKLMLRAEVVMKYGKIQDSHVPLVGYRDVSVVKRGNFALD